MNLGDYRKKRKQVKRPGSLAKSDIEKTQAAAAYDGWDFHQKHDDTSSAGSAGQMDRNRNWQQGKSTSQYN